MREKMKGHTLHIEDYHRYVTDPSTSKLTVRQLNQVIHVHGFMKLEKKRDKILAAINEIGHNMLINPLRSTLNQNDDTTLPSNPNPVPVPVPVSMEELIADLDTLKWRDDYDNNDNDNGFAVESFKSFSFTDYNVDTQFQIINTTCGKRKRKRVRNKAKPKWKKVFNPVYMTKPRSKKKNVQKRKSLADIIIATAAN